MGLITETIRDIQSETVEHNDDTILSGAYTVHDWNELTTKQITVSGATVVGIQLSSRMQTGGTSTTGYGASRVLLDGDPILVSQHFYSNSVGGSGDIKTKGLMLSLGTGSYTFSFQECMYQNGSNNQRIDIYNIRVGTFVFPDDSYDTNDNTTTAVATVTESIINTINLTAPSTRATVTGNIRKYTAILTVHSEDLAPTRDTVFNNTGESNEANKLNVKVFWDGVQADWNDRQDNDVYSSGGTTGEGCWARAVKDFSPGDTPVLTVRVYNGFAGSKNVRNNCYVTLCPWFIGSESEPVELDNIPQGSTLYIMTEPLYEKPTTSINIGRKRGIDNGDSNEYFSENSGTDRQSVNYTFEIANPDSSVIYFTGVGAAVSFLAVDTR